MNGKRSPRIPILPGRLTLKRLEDADQVTALVCYQFPDNDLMMREVFSLGNGRITGSVQSAVGDTCEEF
jgi:hypothetical protein